MLRVRLLIATLSLSLCLVAEPCAAYLREFVTTHEHQRVAGAQVCFYRAGGVQSAFSLFFAHGSDIGCLPADRVIDMPAGVWTVFARQPGVYTSVAQEQLSALGDAHPEEDYAPLEIPMRAAAILDVAGVLETCKAGCEVGVWLDSTDEYVGTYIPLIPGEHEITVPANLPFVPLRIVSGQVSAIGNVQQLRAGERRAVPAFAPPARDRSDVAISLKAAHEASMGALRPPAVAIAASGKPIAPLFGIRHAGAINDLLVLFKNVPAGARDVTLYGRMWEDASVRFVAQGGTVTNVGEPLLATPAAALRVDWTLQGAPPPVSNEPCGAAGTPPPQRIAATVLECRAGAAGCTEVRVASAPPGTSEIVFESIPAGKEYVVSVTGLGQQPRKQTVVTRVAEEAVVHVESEAVAVYGHVRRGGSPLRARLTFKNGEALSDRDTGSFTAFLPAQPWNNGIAVRPCDAKSVYQYAAETLDSGTTLEIDVPDHETIVRVTDGSGKAVAGAIVGVTLLTGDTADPRVLGTDLLTTDDTGAANAIVSADRLMTICAEKKEYERACLTARRFPDREVSIVLKRSETVFAGKLITEGSAAGRIAWVNAGGIVTEQSHVTPEGEFTYTRPHIATDCLVYLSPFHPLAVFPGSMPPNGETLELVLRPDTIFQAVVHLSDACSQESALIGLWLDGRYVPLDLFAAHQASRRSDVFLGHGHSLVIADLAAHSVAIALGPDTAHLTGEIGDPFVRPEYRSLRRVPLINGREAELCERAGR